MKAKTLYQPFATLIAEGFKTIETRSQPPPLSLMSQRIAIHAGKRPVNYDEWSIDMQLLLRRPWKKEIWPYGVVVATARLSCAHKVERTTGDIVHLLPGAQTQPYRLCSLSPGALPRDH